MSNLVVDKTITSEDFNTSLLDYWNTGLWRQDFQRREELPSVSGYQTWRWWWSIVKIVQLLKGRYDLTVDRNSLAFEEINSSQNVMLYSDQRFLDRNDKIES